MTVTKDLSTEGVVDQQLHSADPSVGAQDPNRSSWRISRFEERQGNSKTSMGSDRFRSLLSERQKDGSLPWHPYSKWYGAHWILSSLADLYYPSGDSSLIPPREQVFEWLTSGAHHKDIRKHGELVRAHASMEGNAVYYLTKLGLSDDRTRALVDKLVEWQWPDGGWNCDQSSTAHTSSFTESLWPLRGLVHFSSIPANKRKSFRGAIEKSVEYFLQRKLFKRLSDGSIINENFTKLHFPCYWHYDILSGLKVMKEAGYAGDERCSDAISLLKSKRLEDGGFHSEAAYYRVFESHRSTSGRSLVNWGGKSRKRMNEFCYNRRAECAC